MMMLIQALFGFGFAIALLCLAIAGAVLTVVLQVIAGVLWVAIKICNAEPEILIIIEDDERPMRDVTPRLKALNATQAD
jgi:hypothetical protein